MSYFATCSFDLANASRADYINAYSDLATLGLTHVLPAANGNQVTLPTTMVAGELSGTGGAISIRDTVMARIKAAFTARGLKSEIFLTISGDSWAWSHSTT